MFVEIFSFNKSTHTDLTVYLHDENSEYPPIEKRPFILVIPGGGYSFGSECEGELIALRFSAHGYHTGVLRFHASEYQDFQEILEDSKKAMAKIRKLSQEWAIDSERIVVLGFSDGGYLAIAMSNLLEEKPSLCILGYPVILKTCSDMMQLKVPSLEKFVTPDTPPTFLCTTFENNLFSIEGFLLYLSVLEENDVPFETIIFQKGKHGLAWETQRCGGKEEIINARFDRWFNTCIEWMELNWEQIEHKYENLAISEWCIKNFWRNSSCRELLLTYFPSWQDGSTYKLIRNLSFMELMQIFPEKYQEKELQQLLEKLALIVEKSS